jgi:protease I
MAELRDFPCPDIAIRVAILISDGFEYRQFEACAEALKRAGVEFDLLASREDQLSNGIRGMNRLEPAGLVWPARSLLQVSPQGYRGLLIPGGVVSVDSMRESICHRAFAKSFLNDQKPVALIGHAAWILADSGALRGYTLTSSHTIRKDLERSGAIWKDCKVLRDRNLISAQEFLDCAEFLQQLEK